MNEDESLKILENHAAQLMEHFDSVQIFATKTIDKDTTLTMNEGFGNWYARYGQICEWLIRQKVAITQNEMYGND